MAPYFSISKDDRKRIAGSLRDIARTIENDDKVLQVGALIALVSRNDEGKGPHAELHKYYVVQVDDLPRMMGVLHRMVEALSEKRDDMSFYDGVVKPQQ